MRGRAVARNSAPLHGTAMHASAGSELPIQAPWNARYGSSTRTARSPACLACESSPPGTRLRKRARFFHMRTVRSHTLRRAIGLAGRILPRRPLRIACSRTEARPSRSMHSSPIAATNQPWCIVDGFSAKRSIDSASARRMHTPASSSMAEPGNLKMSHARRTL